MRTEAASIPLQDVRRPSGPEMADVNALGHPDADPALQRLMHVAEQNIAWLSLLDRLQQRLAPPLHPPRHCVVQQVRDGGWDVGAEHVNLADGLDFGSEDLVIE